jgi:hypothetical protein
MDERRWALGVDDSLCGMLREWRMERWKWSKEVLVEVGRGRGERIR